MFSLDSCRRVPFRIGLPMPVRHPLFRVQVIERHPTPSLLHYETGAGHLAFHDFPTSTRLRLVKLGVGEEPVLPIPTITLILV